MSVDTKLVKKINGLLASQNSFNENANAEITPQFQYSFRHNNNNRVFTTKVGGLGEITNLTNNCRIESPSSTTDYAIITSIPTNHYRNGQTSIMRMTTVNITSPTPTVTQTSFNLWGWMDRSNAPSATTLPQNFIGFGYNELDGFFVAIKNSDNVSSTFSTLFVKQDSWNGASLSITLDPTKFNIFEIRMVYLGYLGVDFCIYDPGLHKIIIVHTYKHANIDTLSYTNNAILSIGGLSQNDVTSITAGDLRIHSIMTGVMGKDINNFPSRSVNVSTGTVSDGTFIFVIQNSDTYSSLDNFARFFITSVNCAANNTGSNTSSIKFFKNNIFSVAPTYTDVDTANSIIRTASAGNVGTISNVGVLVYSISLQNNDSISIENLNNIYVEPDAEIAIRVDTSGGNSAVNLSLLISEDY